jgi:hypothetical protein
LNGRFEFGFIGGDGGMDWWIARMMKLMIYGIMEWNGWNGWNKMGGREGRGGKYPIRILTHA